MSVELRTRSGQGQAGVFIGRQAETLTATIAASAAQSNAIDLHANVLVALVMPAVWTTAAISFLGATALDGTYYPVLDDAGTEVIISSANAVAARVIVNNTILEKLAALRFIKFRSGGVGAEVNQAAERVLTLLVKG